MCGTRVLRIRKQEGAMQRRRSAPHTFEENLAAHKASLEARISKVKPGVQQDELVKKIEQLEAASRMVAWLSQPRST